MERKQCLQTEVEWHVFMKQWTLLSYTLCRDIHILAENNDIQYYQTNAQLHFAQLWQTHLALYLPTK